VSIIILRVHICTFGDEKLGDFLVTLMSRPMQRSQSTIILRIHIRAISQVLFNCFNISRFSSYVNSDVWRLRPTPHQNHGCDCCE
jgi:hypothetical protein